MATEKFDAENWVTRLAHGLKSLARIQENYWEELDGQDVRSGYFDDFPDPSEKFRRFYWRASSTKSRFQMERYAPVRATLTVITGILCAHPAWAALVGASPRGDIWFQFPGGGGSKKPTESIGGLMARGKQVGGDGFRVACSELNLLLEPDREGDEDPRREELLTGYHVVLFQGLMVEEEVRIGGDLMIVPFRSLDAFFDIKMLERLAPEVGRRGGGNSISAIVKPFRWRPIFLKNGESSTWDGTGNDSFFEDAQVLIELLALFHAAPVVHLVTVADRVHSRACLLLGSMDRHRSYAAGRSTWSFGVRGRPVEAQHEAIDAAASAFGDRNGERYRNCAPVIARLAEALARQGRFRTEDRILDVAIALEQMYELDQGEISFKLKTRAACFLETRTRDRLGVFKDVDALYEARSGIVHRRGRKRKRPKESLEEERQAAFDRGFGVARRSIVRLLKVGPPPDWNEMVLEAQENGGGERRGGAKTTARGFRNRNGQTVIRRTDTSGNDHNQMVYELECCSCGHRYGANGSDIWQRKCPNCGGGRPGLSYS